MKPRWPVYGLLLVALAGAGWLGASQFGLLRPAALEGDEEVRMFLDLAYKSGDTFDAALAKTRRHWQPGYRYPILDLVRNLGSKNRRQLMKLLADKSGEDFRVNFRKWREWSWNQEYQPSPYLAQFKASFFSSIDPDFAAYFKETETATIRLDEIQWGGVERDGIPPLKDPAMLSADKATYLEDSNVVFGITINGESKCYPKRILAWHEMFKDTIGGESVCGVY